MHYEFTVIPFGLTDALATFICLMNNVLHKYQDKLVLVFIDDILLYSKNEAKHKENITIVLQTFIEHKLYAKLRKCEFYKYKI